MTNAVSGPLLGAIPAGLRKELTDQFDKIVENFRLQKWEASELNAGKFCEVVYSILKGLADGKYPSKATKSRNMVIACAALESAMPATEPRGLRIQIPRMLVALYEIRNNRNVGHVGGDVDPDHMDAVCVLAMCRWIMAELVRVFHNVSTDRRGKDRRLPDRARDPERVGDQRETPRPRHVARNDGQGDAAGLQASGRREGGRSRLVDRVRERLPFPDADPEEGAQRPAARVRQGQGRGRAVAPRRRLRRAKPLGCALTARGPVLVGLLALFLSACTAGAAVQSSGNFSVTVTGYGDRPYNAGQGVIGEGNWVGVTVTNNGSSPSAAACTVVDAGSTGHFTTGTIGSRDSLSYTVTVAGQASSIRDVTASC